MSCLPPGSLDDPRWTYWCSKRAVVDRDLSSKRRSCAWFDKRIQKQHEQRNCFFFDEAIQKIYYCHIQDEADDCAICQFKENIILKTQWKTKTTFDNFSILNDSETSNERVEKQFLKKLHTLTGVGRGIRRSRGKYKFWFHKCAICLMFTVYGRSLPMWFNLKKKHAIVESWLHSAINILKYVSFII